MDFRETVYRSVLQAEGVRVAADLYLMILVRNSVCLVLHAGDLV